MEIHCSYHELVDPTKLKPNPENPNEHSLDDARELIKLYEFYGIRHPIIVSKETGMIVVGHGRHQAALMAEMETFPVEYQSFKSYDEEYGFLVADNGSADRAVLNLAKINAKIPDLHLPNLDLLGIKNFRMDPPPVKTKKPKICPSCGHDFNAPVE